MRKAEWKSVARNPLTSVWLLVALVGSVVAVWTHNIGVAMIVLLVTAVLAYRIWSKAKWAQEDGVIVVEGTIPVEVGEKIYLVPVVEDERQGEYD